MTISIEVEDEAWQALAGLDQLARIAVASALSGACAGEEAREIALLFTDDQSIAQINADWRGANKPTNVLSFPASPDMPIPDGEPRPLGDIVLSHGVIAREAAEQGKTLHDHTAHLIVHGVLHLLGFDHETDDDAGEMERLETSILKGLGISDPYE
jgi:probable rRNA maturation factor